MLKQIIGNFILFYFSFTYPQNRENDAKKMFQYDVQYLKHQLGAQVKEGSEIEPSMLNFLIHDTDKDGYLDGLELRRMITHNYEHIRGTKLTEDEQISVIDRMFELAKPIRPNLISYTEFLKAAEKNA